MGLLPRFLYPFESNTVTTTLTKTTDNAGELFPHAILGKDYSNNELNLIKAIWTDTKVVAQSKMQLCIDLFNLKQELDAHDPNANGGNGGKGQTRFWKAFEEGDLPEYVCAQRQRAVEWLAAAEFATSGQLTGAPVSSLLALTPSTVCKLSRIQHPKATELAAHHLQVHDFIGHDAAAYLAKSDLKSAVLDGINAWLDANPTKALVPSVIRQIEAQVEQSERKASTPAHLKPQATASSPEVIDYQPPTITAEQRHQRNQELLREQNIRDTRAAIEAPEREEAAELAKFHKLYADALAEAVRGLTDLRRALSTISSVKGTIYLDELRDYKGPLGFNYLENDVAELQRCKDTLIEVVKLATSRTGPQSIDWETINTEAQ